MHIFISGIGGTGMAPLAEIAQDAGHQVSGSDRAESAMSQQLSARGIAISFEQTTESLAAEHRAHPVDWFIYTSALPADHPELVFAQKHGIRTSKRDEFINEVIQTHHLKLLAVAGTHGKTTATGMLIWTMKQLGIPTSYSIGTTIAFGPSGRFDQKSKYFIYECDEYDRNFLHFAPEVAIIPSLDYDHRDTYPTKEDYKQAFRDFFDQSRRVLCFERDYRWLKLEASDDVTVFAHQTSVAEISLPGQVMRDNAYLVVQALHQTADATIKELEQILSKFPGTSRRFEKLGKNLYSDYAHHPSEISGAINMAKEINPEVVVIYQPHQNLRQHEVQKAYKKAFDGSKKVYWLPTFLSREGDLPVLTPEDLIKNLATPSLASPAEMDDGLLKALDKHRQQGDLVLVIGAGSIDPWLRQRPQD